MNSSTEINWDQIKHEASKMSAEKALFILEGTNQLLRSEGKKDLLDIKTLLDLKRMKEAAARGEEHKFCTEPPTLPEGRVAVIDQFHPRKPGVVVAYENEEGDVVEEVEKWAHDSEYLRIRRVKAEREAAAKTKDKVKESETPSEANNNEHSKPENTESEE